MPVDEKKKVGAIIEFSRNNRSPGMIKNLIEILTKWRDVDSRVIEYYRSLLDDGRTTFPPNDPLGAGPSIGHLTSIQILNHLVETKVIDKKLVSKRSFYSLPDKEKKELVIKLLLKKQSNREP